MDYHFLVVILMCCSLYSISASYIKVDPQNTDAFEGANVTLYCTVQNLGGNTVVWRDFDAGTEYSKNRTIVAPSHVQPGRYSITGNDTEGTFNLEITGITKSLNHNQKYQCTIPGANVFSKKAELQVYNMPPSPTCSAVKNNPGIQSVPRDYFVEGEDVKFECTFKSALPNVVMNLTRNGNKLYTGIVDPDLNVRRSTISANVIATSDDNGAWFRCSVDHQILNKLYECSLTINVMYKPIVEITQMGMISDGTALYTCDAVSNPNATLFQWSLCLANTDIDCYQSGNGTLTLTDSEEVADKLKLGQFGSGIWYVFKNGDTRLPVYLLRYEDLLTSEEPGGSQCLLKCSVSNVIGVGNDEYTIDNTICVMGNESTTILVPTTPMPSRPMSLSINEGLAGWVYFVIGCITGFVFCSAIFLLKSRMTKTLKTNLKVPPPHERSVDDTRQRANDEQKYVNSSNISSNMPTVYMDLIRRSSDVSTEYMNVPSATAYMELTPKP